MFEDEQVRRLVEEEQAKRQRRNEGMRDDIIDTLGDEDADLSTGEILRAIALELDGMRRILDDDKGDGGACKELNVSDIADKRLERLYGLLEELEAAGRDDDAAALRWAIFNLEIDGVE